MAEDTNNNFNGGCQLQWRTRTTASSPNFKLRRKSGRGGRRPISGNKKHEWRLLGARGRNKRFCKVKKKAITEEQAFFLLRYFYFLNGGYFRYFIELLGAPAILLGAPSNARVSNGGMVVDGDSLRWMVLRFLSDKGW